MWLELYTVTWTWYTERRNEKWNSKRVRGSGGQREIVKDK